jgi:hypothetical protein
MFCCLKLGQRSWEIMRLRIVCSSRKHGMNFVLRKWETWYSNYEILMVAINGFQNCSASTNTWPCNEVRLWASTYFYLSVVFLRRQKQTKRNHPQNRVSVRINCTSDWYLCLWKVVKFSYIQCHFHLFFFTPQGRFATWWLSYNFTAISAFCKQGAWGRFHVQWAPCHHDMAHPHVGDAEDGMLGCRAAVDVSNNN